MRKLRKDESLMFQTPLSRPFLSLSSPTYKLATGGQIRYFYLLKHPGHLLLEQAGVFCPQNGEANGAGAFFHDLSLILWHIPPAKPTSLEGKKVSGVRRPSNTPALMSEVQLSISRVTRAVFPKSPPEKNERCFGVL